SRCGDCGPQYSDQYAGRLTCTPPLYIRRPSDTNRKPPHHFLEAFLASLRMADHSPATSDKPVSGLCPDCRPTGSSSHTRILRLYFRDADVGCSPTNPSEDVDHPRRDVSLIHPRVWLIAGGERCVPGHRAHPGAGINLLV